MAKKKTAGSTGHSSQSFADLVSTAQLAQLKPLIHEEIQKGINALADHVLQKLIVLELRQGGAEAALMRYDDAFDALLKNSLMDIEDLGMGARKTSAPAQKGDVVRLDVLHRKIGAEKWNGPNPVTIAHAGVESEAGTLQTPEWLEVAALGKSEGEKINHADIDGSEVEITVTRVSRYIPMPKAE